MSSFQARRNVGTPLEQREGEAEGRRGVDVSFGIGKIAGEGEKI